MAGIFFLALIPGLAFGQSANDRKGWGYGFVGAGAATGVSTEPLLVNVGGGGEALVYKGLGVGAELGYLARADNFGGGIGIFSVNTAYHLGGQKAGKKFVPFLSGGYSLFFRDGAASGGNIGGGFQYWAGNRAGLRFEIRDHIVSSDRAQSITFRIGLTFR